MDVQPINLARVVSCSRTGGLVTSRLRFSVFVPRPLSPGWIGWPPASPTDLQRLELHRLVAIHGSIAEFETDVATASSISVPARDLLCCFYPLWDDEQLEFARDSQRVWSPTVFAPKNAVSRRVGETIMLREAAPGEVPAADAAIIEGGWDHEHCVLCYGTIQHGGPAPVSVYCSGEHWLCGQCHTKYVVGRAAANWGDRA